GFGIACFIGVLACICSLISDRTVPARNIKNKEEYDNNQALLAHSKEKYALRLKELNEAKRKLTQMKKNSIVPEKYLGSASTLLEFLEDGRADNMKEALNLLHQYWDELDRYHEMERHHRALEQENAQHNAQVEAALRRNSAAAERAADAAEDAAYWEKRKYYDDFFDDLIGK
ncbi:MAG: hypothetical protein Q4P20_00005, partial [Eubacteriales bacterium]|nr:hypothetical protein [Eubacteriales bacterium]